METVDPTARTDMATMDEELVPESDPLEVSESGHHHHHHHGHHHGRRSRRRTAHGRRKHAIKMVVLGALYIGAIILGLMVWAKLT